MMRNSINQWAFEVFQNIFIATENDLPVMSYWCFDILMPIL